MRGHGNWCGPGWTAGQSKPAKDLTKSDKNVPAIDALDQACKDHDIALSEATTSEEVSLANQRFIEQAKNTGIKGKLFSLAVSVLGPSQPDMPRRSPRTTSLGNTFVTPKKKRFRGTDISPDTQSAKKIRTVEPDLDGSLSNKPSDTMDDVTMSMSAMATTKPNGAHETPVDEVQDVERGPSKFQFATLPYIRGTVQSGTVNTYDVAFRMTSPLDCFIDNTGQQDLNANITGALDIIGISPVGVTDVKAGAEHDTARWFDFYKSQYKYYHVVSARWKLVFENLTNDMMYLHEMYINDQTPPYGATNQDMMCWNDVKTHVIGPQLISVNTQGLRQTYERGFDGENTATQTTPNYNSGGAFGNSPLSPLLTLSGTYSPGDLDAEVRLDSDVENWTLCDANPRLREALLLRIKHYGEGRNFNNTVNYNRPIRFSYRITIDYLVEFKELLDGIRWPVQRQPAVVTLQQSVSSEN